MNINALLLIVLVSWAAVSILASVTVGFVAKERDHRTVPVSPAAEADAAARRLAS